MFAVALRVIVLLFAAHEIRAADFASRGYVLELDGKFADRVDYTDGGYPRLGGGPVPVVDPLEFAFGPPASAAFTGWLVSSVAAPKATGTIALLRIFNGQEVDRLVLNSPLLRELVIDRLDSQKRHIGFNAKVSYGTIGVLGGTKAASLPPDAPNDRFFSPRLVVDSVVISPIGVSGMGMSFSPSDATTPNPVCRTVSITLQHSDIGWLYDWYRVSVLEPSPAKPATRRVDVQVVDALNGAIVPLATLEKARVGSFHPIMTSSLGVEAELLCTRFTLAPDIFK